MDRRASVVRSPLAPMMMGLLRRCRGSGRRRRGGKRRRGESERGDQAEGCNQGFLHLLSFQVTERRREEALGLTGFCGFSVTMGNVTGCF